MSLPPVLQIRDLQYSFGKTAVIEGLSFELKRGEILAMIGPNGVGKTTALRLISGVIPMDSQNGSGIVHFLGQDFFELDPTERAKRVVYISGEVKTEFPLKAYELVQLGRVHSRASFISDLSEEDQNKIREAMELCGCWGLRNREYSQLSGGEKQLVCFARGLAQGAKVLLLDESFSRLDLQHQSRVGQLLRELTLQGYAFIWVSHDLNFVLEYSTSCLIWPAQGPATQGSVQDVINDSQIRKLYPGARVFTGKNPKTGSMNLFFDR